MHNDVCVCGVRVHKKIKADGREKTGGAKAGNIMCGYACSNNRRYANVKGTGRIVWVEGV